MKTLYYILCCSFLLIANQKSLAEQPVEFYLKNISIEGKTNINYFHFIYDEKPSKTFIEKEYSPTTDNLTFRIPIHQFKSNNPLMTEDFYELLKADKFPYIIVNIDKDQLIRISKGHDQKKLNIVISLAGKTDSIKSQYSVAVKKNKSLVTGGTHIQLSDFDLKPPQKMLGMIQVQNTIFIKFDVIVLTK